MLSNTSSNLYLTDGGLETVLIFHEGIDLPEFASFPLINDPKGQQVLYDYYIPYLKIAEKLGAGFILESPTWRASLDWGSLLNYGPEALYEANLKAITLLKKLKASFETPTLPILISGCIGPRGDGYIAGKAMSVDEAQNFHGAQVSAFKEANVDLISAITMTNIPEALGVTMAAKDAGIPVVISFTVETDGTLPSGDSLQAALETVDKETDNYPTHFMINCAHPSHFEDTLENGGSWLNRIQGVRANASRCSHAELDEAEELDDGNPEEFGQDYKTLKDILPNLRVLGGCCGTDHRHIEAIGKACST